MSQAQNVTNSDVVDQKLSSALFHRLESLRDHLRVSGTVVSTWRTYKGQRLGPYFRLAYRANGRQKSIFIGCDADLADQVRGYVKRLQGPRDEKANLNRARQAAARQFKASLEEFDVALAAVDLRRRGSQVIGWRAWKRRQVWSRLSKDLGEAGKGMLHETRTQH